MRKPKSSKRSQMEIMGLAIIVIIIIFGILLSLIFFRPKDTSLKTDLTDSTLASTMLGVIQRTSLDCKSIELKNLLQDCAEGARNKGYCDQTDNDPCGKVRQIIADEILKKTLDVWKKQYTFSAKIIGGDVIFEDISNTQNCKMGNPKFASTITESLPIPLRNGNTMEISLTICR